MKLETTYTIGDILKTVAMIVGIAVAWESTQGRMKSIEDNQIRQEKVQSDLTSGFNQLSLSHATLSQLVHDLDERGTSRLRDYDNRLPTAVRSPKAKEDSN